MLLQVSRMLHATAAARWTLKYGSHASPGFKQALPFIQGHTSMKALCPELNHIPAEVQYSWSRANWNVQHELKMSCDNGLSVATPSFHDCEVKDSSNLYNLFLRYLTLILCSRSKVVFDAVNLCCLSAMPEQQVHSFASQTSVDQHVDDHMPHKLTGTMTGDRYNSNA